MKVQDYPKTIYVRDIDDETSKNFSKIKKRFSTNSNNEAVKRLINTYGDKVEQLDKCQKKNLKLQAEIERLTDIITSFQYAQQSLLDCKV